LVEYAVLDARKWQMDSQIQKYRESSSPNEARFSILEAIRMGAARAKA
jgi:hypothetical protein